MWSVKTCVELSDDEDEALDCSASVEEVAPGPGIAGRAFFALSLRVEDGVISMLPEVTLKQLVWLVDMAMHASL